MDPLSLHQPPVPAWVGIGWRQPHYRELMERRPALAFIEVHSENFFAEGGAALAVLQRGRAEYPVSLHGVGLGLGSALGVDAQHLEQLARLVERIDPVRVSDHASFARVAGGPGEAAVHASDLLPLPFDACSLDLLAGNIERVQTRLRRPILIENLSAYLQPQAQGSAMVEPAFFNALTRRTGCGLLLDVNNLVVNALNAGRVRGEPADRSEPAAIETACAWIDALDAASVGEIHLAGYHAGGELVIDDHGSRVHAPVWAVYRHALARLGPRPTLIEWDTDVPALDVLLDEVDRAGQCLRAQPGKPRLQTAWPLVSGRGCTAERAAQQGALVAAIRLQPGAAPALQGQPQHIEQGLAAYRGNGWAVAERALAAAYPTVQGLLGKQAFAGLARALWQAHPPAMGDLACWGAALADYLAGPEGLDDAPGLPDTARLDWAMHRAGFACDGPAVVAGLSLLASHDPQGLYLHWSPGAGLLSSAYPIASLRLATTGEGAGEHAWWWRHGWQVQVVALAPDLALFHRTISLGHSLGQALEAVLGRHPDFDFGCWLQQALQQGWLAAVVQALAPSTFPEVT